MSCERKKKIIWCSN